MVDFNDEKSPRVGLEDEAQFETSLVPATDIAHLPAAEIIESGEEVSGSSVIRKPNWIGKRFARFKLLRQLGEGSMGRVILAEDVNLHRVIALKILRKQIKGMDDAQAVQQFLREARGAATIDHPNVVKIYEINEHDGWWYIAMELVEGQTLQQVVRAAGPLSPARACVIIGDAATALEVAHEHGIVHRDVKPSNLMITRQGRCKLTDFGLVRLDSPSDPFELHDKSVGTPKFMAPEVILRRQQGPALDIYSLGATFYFALTGRPPYIGEKVSHILKQHTEAPPPDLRQAIPGCPESLARLLERMMAKDPAQRPSAGDVAAALSSEVIAFRQDSSGWSHAAGSASGFGSAVSLGGSTVSIPEPVRAEVAQLRRGRRARSWIIAILVIAALAFAGWFFLINREPADPVFDAAALDKLFPDAPPTYGEFAPGELPIPLDPLRNPPASSWRGKFDDREFRYVAHQKGRYYYPIDHPDAVLIPANQVDGYQTEEQARAAGKLPIAGR